MKHVSPFIGLFVLGCLPLAGAEFQGADAVLKKLAEQRAKAPEAKAANPGEAFRKELSSYRTEAATLPPQQAAERWLALFNDFYALPNEARNEARAWTDRLSTLRLIEVLPPSADWEALTKAIAAQAGQQPGLRDAGLRLLAAALQGSAGDRKAALDELEKASKKAKLQSFETQGFQQMVDSVADVFADESDDKQARVDAFEKQLAQFEKPQDRRMFPGMMNLRVPDLVKLAGTEKATALFQRVFDAGAIPNFAAQGRETHRLVVKIALQSVDKLKAPPWDLVTEVEDAPLYEALAKRFPNTLPETDYSRANARTVCLVAFIAQGRTKDAAALLADRQWNSNQRANIGRELTSLLAGQGLTRQVRDFLQEALANDPSLQLWDIDIDLSARLGEADQALAFLRKTLARTDLSASAREKIERQYARALLAADQIDQGLDALRAGMKVNAAAHIGTPDAQEIVPEETVWISTGEPLRFAEIGHLLARPELVEEGLKAAREELAKAQPSQTTFLVGQLAQFLSRLGRGAEAEKLLVDRMLVPSKNEFYSRQQLNAQLVVVYHEAGRHADVLKLLDESPDWQAPELSEFHDTSARVPLLFCAAKALAVAGRRGEARHVLDRLLEQRGGYDPAYALLLEMGGDGLEAKLDALAQRDRFEERPLIWKAKLQLDAGRVEEAEKTVRAAIAIDPSDGEEGKGDRMRAYAVLGDVLEKKGDTDQAKIMRGAVEAIRLSENADDWWQAGLLTRAVKMYEQALGHFADAYCIQSRLALRYSELGDLARAEQHYQRAFELMPESFGRIESHCFGCEHAFEGEHAQNIAERVFTRLAEKPDARPQVFYLLGYLREEQKRDAEAAAQYEHAVKLDPDYFNAWSRLAGVASAADLASPENEAAQLAMLRLDPTLRHHQPNFQGFRHLSRLWDAVLAAEKAQPQPTTDPVYPLPAAKAEIERRKQAAKTANGGMEPGSTFNYQLGMDFREQSEQQRNIRVHFAQQPVLMAISGLLDMAVNHASFGGIR